MFSRGRVDLFILESDQITGPWNLVTYLKHFGQQAYFFNIPSKFISKDGRTMWLCYSANFASGWGKTDIQSRPEGSKYAMCLQEIRLLTPGAFDVVSIAGVGEQQGFVYFLASPDNPTQRNLYCAPLNGRGAAVRVSPPDQPGTHSYAFSKDGRWAFHTFSRLGQPPVIELVRLPEHKVVRTRWSCGLLAETLAWETGTRLSAETVRRGLKRLGWVWRRPRPVVGPSDPEYDAKVRQIRNLLAALPDDETALFQDEVDVHLNPKIGSCWIPRGQQAEVVTPGNNEKRHVAGSLHWRTGTLLVSRPSTRRNTQLFLEHLDDLRRALRGYRKIHVICDNGPFHTSTAVRRYLAKWGHRIQLHFLRKYAPETNPIDASGGTSTKPSPATIGCA